MMRYVLAGLLLAAPAGAQDWFLHEYGELRAYHGDWLAVCDEAGAGPCRVVQTGTDPGSDAYFDLRLAAQRIDNSPDWAIEVMDRNMPAQGLTELTLSFDGVAVAVPQGAWTAGDMLSPNASDTVTIRDPDLALDLVARMKAGNRVTVTYAPLGEGDGRASFPLRGVTAAMNAIEARVLARQE
ncbi:hypothetical protein [Antarcticimicrobium luteum]|uniref:Invasion associated locus B family protein n=1 Tax=Antarcticimicrobium luteum TaxID=2547397 RepID=A0A4R5V7V0_9RHOB|nr:hypothetical protein [Antarcticimicrobium luteum]TDK48024.1 hypothetical protein E1832_10195 [Antarcticimicrobium luteum]